MIRQNTYVDEYFNYKIMKAILFLDIYKDLMLNELKHAKSIESINKRSHFIFLMEFFFLN